MVLIAGLKPFQGAEGWNRGISLYTQIIYTIFSPLQPVRAELMQALWSTLHNHDDTVATVAFRVLGKFGGSNRKMLSTPQPVSELLTALVVVVVVFVVFVVYCLS